MASIPNMLSYMVTIVSLIETARANNSDPYYYLKYLMDQMHAKASL